MLYPGEVQESHTEGEVAARMFLPTLLSEAGPAVVGELSLSVTGIRLNSMGSVPSRLWMCVRNPWEPSILLTSECVTSVSGLGVP